MSERRRFQRPIRHVVFYGTLRAGYAAHVRLKLRAALRYVGKCTLAGSLYDLGPYPGFVPGAGTAEGEIYWLKDSAILAGLDAFEGFDARRPERSRFVRKLVRVPRTAHGSAIRLIAWIYVWNGVTARRRKVPGGLWPRDRRPRHARK
jgi:gamma-glutamylcyclotransferase (GGCT)/AIG2-like uncharacterized protein YtfP